MNRKGENLLLHRKEREKNTCDGIRKNTYDYNKMKNSTYVVMGEEILQNKWECAKRTDDNNWFQVLL